MSPTSTEVKRKPTDSKTVSEGPLTAEELRKMHAWWRAANYLSVGQIYLMDNPLLRSR
jgi:xylulose-5-phosphate/fructose-6-phosphate phosphoketolase